MPLSAYVHYLIFPGLSSLEIGIITLDPFYRGHCQVILPLRTRVSPSPHPSLAFLDIRLSYYNQGKHYLVHFQFGSQLSDDFVFITCASEGRLQSLLVQGEVLGWLGEQGQETVSDCLA